MAEPTEGSIVNVKVDIVNISKPVIEDEDDYDDVGAMEYVVCVITVYAFFGVFCLLLARIRFRRDQKGRAGESNSQAEATRKYLKAEKSLKHEAFRMKMLSEIEKHSENIKNFEERARLMEIENEVKAEDFNLNLKASRKIKRKLERDRKKFAATLRERGLRHSYSRKVSQTYNNEYRKPLTRRLSTSAAMKKAKLKNGKSRRASATDAFGRIGFSFLFMDATNSLHEESESSDTESTSSCCAAQCQHIESSQQLTDYVNGARQSKELRNKECYISSEEPFVERTEPITGSPVNEGRTCVINEEHLIHAELTEKDTYHTLDTRHIQFIDD